MKNKDIRISFPIMILIEVFATWFIGQFNTSIGITVGIISALHIIAVWTIGQILKKKQKEAERK